MSESDIEDQEEADPTPSGASAELIQRLREEQEALRHANEQLAVTEEELRIQNEELTQWRGESERLKARYQNLFNEAPDAYIVTDPQGNIQEANLSAAQIFGCAAEKLTEYRLTDLLPVKIENAQESFSSQFRREGLVLPLTGVPFWASITCAPSRDETGKVDGLRWLIRDVTDRKKVTDALAESEARSTALTAQLRELASELTLTEQRERQRIARILHDQIQQMLVAAKMQTSTLLNRLSNEDQDSTLRLVYDLLGQTLSASRSLTAELSPPVLYDIGLGPALMWLARSVFEKHGLQVEVSFDPSGEPRVEDVRVFLFDAIREVLFNVVKHSGAQKARVDCCRGNDGLLRVVVSDEGKGFDPINIKTGERSEGLGLFSIQQRLKHMGGRLEVDSAPGAGTRITLIGPPLSNAQHGPLPSGKSQFQASRAKTVARSEKIRVILADDHHIIREGLARVLSAEPDIEVVGEAANGAQAINLVRSLSPDIIVMDVSMPVLSGIEATAEIRRDMPDVKVIGLSMHEEGELSSAIRQAGAVAYVTKGGPPAALVSAIRKAAAM